MFTLALLLLTSPCELGAIRAECGSLRVPENRSKEGRTIEVHYAVLPASAGKRSSGALFVLAGGPGQAATTMAGFVSRIFQNTGRDIVLVDARGTGKSNPLPCDFGGSERDLQGYFDDMLPIDPVERCKKELAPRADLTQYTTRAIADDLEAVRNQLGYATIDLYGTSYGTRVALEMMRHHPKHVRSVILDGVVPPSLASPSTFAPDAQRSLDAVMAMCREDAACRAAFPELGADFEAVMEQAERGIELDVTHPKTKKAQRVKIHRGFFGEILRNFLYSPERYARLPLALHKAARGDWSAFSDLAVGYAVGIRTLDFGMFLSVTCTEDVPRLDLPAARRAAEGTFLGTYRIDQQVRACEKWVRGSFDPISATPVRSAIPTLIISGELDPVTPARFGDEVARTLSQALHVVIPSGSHSGDTGGCLEAIAADFVRRGSITGLDRACVAKIARPAFAR